MVWRKDAGPVVPGQLLLVKVGIRLRGGSRARPEEHELPFRELADVRIAQGPEERIQGLPSLLLELRSLDRFLVAGVGGLGVVNELADLIAIARSLA